MFRFRPSGVLTAIDQFSFTQLGKLQMILSQAGGSFLVARQFNSIIYFSFLKKPARRSVQLGKCMVTKTQLV